MPDEDQRKVILFVVIILISFNLRPAITGVGPLIGEIRLDTGLSNTSLGLLTTLPVLAFGFFSVLTPLFTRRIGTEGTMALALAFISGGLLLRIAEPLFTLFAGTIIVGTGIALGNVLLPGIVKRQFPTRVGIITGAYSAVLGVGATVASGISVPLSQGAGLGWRWALGVWGFIALFALIAWLPQLKVNMPVVQRKSFLEALSQLGTSRLAWMVALFMGLQSLTFYTLITWLPEILIDRGMDAPTAGWMLALMQAVGVIATLFIPAWAAKRKRQRFPVFLIVVLELVAVIGLMLPTLTLAWLWASIMGFCLGGSFGLALLFIVLRSRDIDSANELSGMSQSIGYGLASTGPVIFGAMFDVGGSWIPPLAFLFIIAVIKMWAAWSAGKDQYV